ncbi:alpha/beta fold hydrolase [Brevundimonas sp.]|uniref:alpha/beta fold hydrolase n=1 Tax=Brevundimonas sp. TaxID=1871086 RepID=UPI003A90AD76
MRPVNHDKAPPTGTASGRFEVRVDGPERPVGDLILIPGLGSSPAIWDELIHGLVDRWRIHSLHIRGFAGLDPGDNGSGAVADPVAEDLARYITTAGLVAPAVIGHSMGGTIGLMLAARHPGMIGRLMVVDMVPFLGALFGGTGATAASVGPVADQMFASVAHVSHAQYLIQATASVSGMIDTPARRAGPVRDSTTSSQAVTAAALRELIVTDLTPELARITVPVTVLHARFSDPRMTAATTNALYQAAYAPLPGAVVIRVEDSGHFIMLDQPERFASEVNAFLE